MYKIKAAVNRNMVCAMALLLWPIGAEARNASYVLAEYASGQFQVVESENARDESPVGSLLKPFAAWYLLENGHDAFQNVYCPPERKRTESLRCWTPEGHGETNLASALVHSCNYYFLSLFAGKNLRDYQAWLEQRFDWPARLPITKPVHVYGFDLAHGIEPEKLLRMYTLLLQAAENNNGHALRVRDALAGICMGTLAEACAGLHKVRSFRLLLGKTGTVQSAGRPWGATLLYLEHLPTKRKFLLLCYEKNKTGSQAAMRAAAILSRYDGKNRKR